ncbi:hypothetical protein HK101_002584, partial [Irineochytrium annulatum]
TMNTVSFTGSFVRTIASDVGLRAEVASSLSRGQAFENKAELAVAMIDISGYSKMAAELTFLGKMASEVITRSVGAYLNKIIDVIGLFSGDIVKFLGDAVLVVFSARCPSETFDLVVLRATACCLAINTRYSTMELDMKLAETSAALHAGEHAYSGNFVSGRAEKGSATTLHLHFAVAAGAVSRLILGDWASRLDYAIFGECLSSLGPILNGTKKGELGLTSEVADALIRILGNQVLSCLRSPAEVKSHTLLGANELQSLMSVIFSTEGSWMQLMTDSDALALFDNRWAAPTPDVALYPPLREGDGNDEGMRISPARSKSSPHVQDTTMGTFLGRCSSASEASELSGVNGSFRTVAAVFVSLLFPFELAKVQRVVVYFLAALRKYGGIFQQYSYDDKGQTLLAIFGLPPFTHVNNSDQCIQAMKLFTHTLRAKFQEPVDLAISVATGDVLFTTIGTNFRSEAGLLGLNFLTITSEVVIIAARLLSAAQVNRMLVMDEPTYECVKLSNETIDLGIVKAKGRAHGVHAYGINVTSEEYVGELSEDAQFGYKREEPSFAIAFQIDWKLAQGSS